jgi:hypothetical protein
MSSNLSNFYGAAAQTIPVLLLTLVVETSFLAAIMRSRQIERSLQSYDWAGNILEAILRRSLPIAAGLANLEPIRRFTDRMSKLLARPIGATANAMLAFGSLLAAVIAEAASFVGLAFDLRGTVAKVIAGFILAGIGLLLFENLTALMSVVIQSGPQDEQPS